MEGRCCHSAGARACTGATVGHACTEVTIRVRARRFEASMQMQIVRDLSEIEVAITQHVVPVEATGGAHDAVKALKRVVLAADADAAAEARREGLPALLAAHHLLSRTG